MWRRISLYGRTEGGVKTFHCSWDRAGLVREIERFPGVIEISVNGETLRGQDAIAYVVALPPRMTSVPMGCPTPREDGTCPGHTIN